MFQALHITYIFLPRMSIDRCHSSLWKIFLVFSASRFRLILSSDGIVACVWCPLLWFERYEGFAHNCAIGILEFWFQWFSGENFKNATRIWQKQLAFYLWVLFRYLRGTFGVLLLFCLFSKTSHDYSFYMTLWQIMDP